ncbi:hypothetical protein N7931_15615 [Catenovulum sp. 2E275]|uniref:hypothetical protein n=1 Tax=Catenovulum sp. 2E275 TaxID=2980497 RepID=UPI0021D3B350|nr:hypothetical protein [Catenovulum sp. 2E275]MCU4677061.1 hypothetical protein [Catenovulum sp. 2E275]
MFLIVGFSALILITFYLFYRAETFKKELNIYKARFSHSQSTSKHQSEMIVLLAHSQAELLKNKLNQLRNYTNEETETIKLAEALISQYSNIVNDVALKSQSVSKSTEKYLQRSTSFTSTEISQIIARQNNELKYAWQQNNLEGFIRFCGLLLEPLQTNSSSAL